MWKSCQEKIDLSPQNVVVKVSNVSMCRGTCAEDTELNLQTVDAREAEA